MVVVIASMFATMAQSVPMQAIPGFFVGSDEKDHHVGKYTIKQAVELCEPDPKCFSFTFMGSADTEDEVDVWFKAGQESRLMQSAGWATYAKPRADRKDGISYFFEVGDHIKVTNSFEIMGGPPPKEYLAKELTWPDKAGKMKADASKGLGFTKAWSDTGFGGKIVHKWEDCETFIPALLAPPRTICYVIQADYKGEGMVPETNLAIILDGFEKGTMQPFDQHETAGCDTKMKLCKRYEDHAERCKKCFSSLADSKDSKCQKRVDDFCSPTAGDIEVDIDDEL